MATSAAGLVCFPEKYGTIRTAKQAAAQGAKMAGATPDELKVIMEEVTDLVGSANVTPGPVIRDRAGVKS